MLCAYYPYSKKSFYLKFKRWHIRKWELWITEFLQAPPIPSKGVAFCQLPQRPSRCSCGKADHWATAFALGAMNGQASEARNISRARYIYCKFMKWSTWSAKEHVKKEITSLFLSSKSGQQYHYPLISLVFGQPKYRFTEFLLVVTQVGVILCCLFKRFSK